MPRFKTPDQGLKLILVDFAQHVLPGTFDFALCHRGDTTTICLRTRCANGARPSSQWYSTTLGVPDRAVGTPCSAPWML